MPLFAQNWAEILFSDRVNAILIESKILTAPDECGINPVRLCVEMGGFWRFLASGVSYNTRRKKTNRIFPVYTYASILVNILNEAR